MQAEISVGTLLVQQMHFST